MGKSNGGTRAGSASSPRGLSANQAGGGISVNEINAVGGAVREIERGNIRNTAIAQINDAEWSGSNGIYRIETEYGKAGVSYMPIDGGYNVIVNGEMHEDAFSPDLATAQINAKNILIEEALRRLRQ